MLMTPAAMLRPLINRSTGTPRYQLQADGKTQRGDGLAGMFRQAVGGALQVASVERMLDLQTDKQAGEGKADGNDGATRCLGPVPPQPLPGGQQQQCRDAE